MDQKKREEIESSDVNRLATPAEDREYVLAAMKGDKNAYGRLVVKYQKRLFRFVFMMLGKKDTTDDIIQDAFVKGYTALSSFDSDKQFYPWIATIARNLALNRIKRDSREKPVSEFEDHVISIPDSDPDPHDKMIIKENDKRFFNAVQSLPEQYRMVFVMRMFEKMSYDEISKKLGISPGTVDSRLFRARQKLVELLKEYL